MNKVLKHLYFDYNATTPVLPRIANKINNALLENYGNPSSTHIIGRTAFDSIAKAKNQLSRLINSESDEIIFTANATESNNMSVFGILRDSNDHFITCETEHPAILVPSKILEKKGMKVTYLPVDRNGLINIESLKANIQTNTRLISIMTANNETGVIQNIQEIGNIARQNGIIFHTDAAQAIGKIKVDVKELNVNLMTVAGHKFYAPKGIGALYVKRGTQVNPLMFGGGQERGIRPGTENVPYIAGIGEACEIAYEDLQSEGRRQLDLGETFLSLLKSSGIKNYRINGDGSRRLPNTCSVAFGDYNSGQIMNMLKDKNVYVSAGAACHESEHSISHVLKSMGVEKKFALGTIRFSWGRYTTKEDIHDLVERLVLCLIELDKKRI